MRPRGDRGTAKAVGAWMPGDFPRNPGSCCHGPLKTLGTLAPWPVSCPEKLTEPRPPPPHPAAPHPCTASSRPRSRKESEREREIKENYFHLEGSFILFVAKYLLQRLYLPPTSEAYIRAQSSHLPPLLLLDGSLSLRSQPECHLLREA